MKAAISPAVERLQRFRQLRRIAKEFFETGDFVVGAARYVVDQGFRRVVVREFDLVSACLAIIGRKTVAEYRPILRGLSSQSKSKAPVSRRSPNVSSMRSAAIDRRQSSLAIATWRQDESLGD